MDEAGTRARIASLEMDVRERDAKIAAMKKEYTHLGESSRQAAEGAGSEQMEKLFRKLAAPLSTMAALATMAEEGQDVSAADIAALFRGVEKQLRAAGMEPTFQTGDTQMFDPALHQRMSGGAVSTGSPVVVRSPGYRYAGKVLLKAMVSSPEDSNG